MMLSSTERLLQTFLLQENQPLSNRGLLPNFLIPAKLLIVQNKIVSYLLFMCGSANQHICKSAYLQISISTNQHIYKSAYLRISISTNQHIYKSAYLQISISANQLSPNSTMPLLSVLL